MLRDGTVERVTGNICWALAGCFGPYIDCHFLRDEIEDAVWLCMMDSPHCEQLEIDPRARLACRVRDKVNGILSSHHIAPEWQVRVARDVETAVVEGLKGN